MGRFTINEWLLLNSAIYNIYTTSDYTEMRQKLLEQLKLMIDFDSANFYLASKDNPHKLKSPVRLNLEPEFTEKYLKNYSDIDYSTGIMFSGNSLIYRESDILPENERVKTDYYKMFYETYHFHFSLHFAISKNYQFLGIISLFRRKGKRDFDVDDIMIFELLQQHLEYRMYRRYAIASEMKDKITVHEAVQKYQLTRREETVLNYLLQGMGNDTICDKLCIANNTLKKHILNIYRKLGINQRIQIFKLFKTNSA